RKMVKVNHLDLLFVQSYGEYVKLFTKDDVILALQTTSFMEALLPADHFIRIHRSCIVNLNHITEIEGNQVIVEQHRLQISKRMKEAFLKAINKKGVI
ncbi:MAG: LytTR family DNA-binding domain-containing protein, partial [Bacteroidota bacterium]